MKIGTIRKIISEVLYGVPAFRKENLSIIEYIKDVAKNLEAKDNEDIPTVIIEIPNGHDYFKREEKIIYKSRDVRLVIINNELGHVRTLGEEEIKSIEAKKTELHD